MSVQIELLVGSAAFWDRARPEIEQARRRVLVQAMTFEGDSAGLAAARAVGGSQAADRRVLVDDYTRLMLSDRWVGAGEPPAHSAAEAAQTRAMFRDLQTAGAPVRVTNPVRPSMTNYPARNHKKLLVTEDVAWLGGLNFADHNFAWDDLMVRLEGREVADALAMDFEATWNSRAAPWRLELPSITLIGMDGRSNRRSMSEVDTLIAEARREIVLVSPYATRPFLDGLARARRRGVNVRLITPLANNKPLVRDAMLGFAVAADFELVLIPRMSHLKGLSVDGETVVVGSANFDIVSLEAEEELLAIIRDPQFAGAFQRQVIEPLTAKGLAVPPPRVSGLRLAAANAALSVAGLAARLASAWPRRAADFDWA